MSSGTYTETLNYATNFNVPLLIHIVVCSSGNFSRMKTNTDIVYKRNELHDELTKLREDNPRFRKNDYDTNDFWEVQRFNSYKIEEIALMQQIEILTWCLV